MPTNSISNHASSAPLVSSEQPFPLMDLPEEMLLHIIQQVNCTDALLRTAGTNRRLRGLVKKYEGGDTSRLVGLVKDNAVRRRASKKHIVCPTAPRPANGKLRSRFAR